MGRPFCSLGLSAFHHVFAPVLIVLRCIQEIISTYNGLHDKIMCEIRGDDSVDSVCKSAKV
jgi:hypothetical protein